jgi:hypothetical protein
MCYEWTITRLHSPQIQTILKTCQLAQLGFVTGSAGMGMVLDFDTPQHTVTHTRGIAGTHRYFIMG